MKKQFLSLGLMLLSGVVMAQYPTTGLVAYFPLGDDFNDISPNNILPAGSSYLNGPDRHGNQFGSFAFNETVSLYAEYDMSVYPMLKVDGDITVAFYAKIQGVSAVGGRPTALSFSDKIRVGWNAVNGSTDILAGFDRNSGGSVVSSVSGPLTVATFQQWHHYAYVLEAGTLTIYLDGNVIATASGYGQDVPFNANDFGMVIGHNQYLQNQSLWGWLDDMFIYDRALTANELDDLMDDAPCDPITGNLTIDGPSSLCADGQATYTIQIGQQNVTDYIWEYNGGTGTLTNGSVTITAPSEGQGNPTLTIYGSNECSQGAQFTYAPAVVGTPDPFTITGTGLTCVGSGLAYSVESTGIPVTWDFPNGWVQNNTFPNNNGGQFTAGESGTISFTRDNGCFTRTETLEVTVLETAPAPAVLASSTALCPNEATVISINLDEAATGSQFFYPLGWTYQNDTDTSFTVTAFGNAASATVTHQSSNICGTTEVQISFTKLTETSNYTFIQYYDGLLHVYNPTQGIGHQWLLNGDPIDGANGTTYQPLINGTYSVQSYYNDYDCEPSIGNEIVVEELTVGISETAARALSIYPNPATTSFTISGLTPGNTITLMDATGRIITTYIAHAQRMDIAASSLVPGIYFVQQNTSPAVMKLVKH